MPPLLIVSEARPLLLVKFRGAALHLQVTAKNACLCRQAKIVLSATFLRVEDVPSVPFFASAATCRDELAKEEYESVVELLHEESAEVELYILGE